jgi:hypothetical protein
MNEIRAILEDLKAEGLLLDRRAESYFCFDLNEMGNLLVPSDPVKVYRVLEIARRHGRSNYYGQHGAILNQAAERSKIGDKRVYWERSYHVDAYTNPDRWILMPDWLKQHGFDPSKLAE